MEVAHWEDAVPGAHNPRVVVERDDVGALGQLPTIAELRREDTRVLHIVASARESLTLDRATVRDDGEGRVVEVRSVRDGALLRIDRLDVRAQRRHHVRHVHDHADRGRLVEGVAHVEVDDGKAGALDEVAQDVRDDLGAAGDEAEVVPVHRGHDLRAVEPRADRARDAHEDAENAERAGAAVGLLDGDAAHDARERLIALVADELAREDVHDELCDRVVGRVIVRR